MCKTVAAENHGHDGCHTRSSPSKAFFVFLYLTTVSVVFVRVVVVRGCGLVDGRRDACRVWPRQHHFLVPQGHSSAAFPGRAMEFTQTREKEKKEVDVTP
jgi:hypothetical protein